MEQIERTLRACEAALSELYGCLAAHKSGVISRLEEDIAIWSSALAGAPR